MQCWNEQSRGQRAKQVATTTPLVTSNYLVALLVKDGAPWAEPASALVCDAVLLSTVQSCMPGLAQQLTTAKQLPLKVCGTLLVVVLVPVMWNIATEGALSCAIEKCMHD